MRQIWKNSFFWRLALRLDGRLGGEHERGDGRNGLYARLDRRFRESRLGVICGDGYDRAGWQFRFRRFGMRCREESRMRACLWSVWNYVMESSVGYVGLFLLTLGISLLILVLIVDELLLDTRQLVTAISVIVLSVPLLGSSKPVFSLVEESFFVHRAKRCLGYASMLPLREGTRGRARPMAVLLFSALGVTVAWGITPLLLICGLLLFAAILLLVLLPEVNIPLILFSFPFLSLTKHPTLFLCGFVLILHVAWLLKIYCGRRDFSFELADLSVLLFCILLLLGGAVGFGDASVGVVLSLLASAYFPMKNLLSTALWHRRARTALVAGASVCAVYGIFQYFFTDLELLWVDVDRFFDIGGRVCSFFDNPNILAVYLLLAFPFALCGTLDSEKTALHRFFFSLAALSVFLCLVLTWSRGAWLALLFELFLTFAFHGRRSRALLLLLLPTLALSVLFLPQSVIRRFLSIGNLAESSIRYRLYTWRGVLDMIHAHPFGIGVGEEAFRSVYPHFARSGIETVMHAHNVFLQTAAEIGVIGGASLAFVLTLALLKGFGRRRAAGAPYALCGVLIMGMFDHLWYAPSMICMVFAALAFSLLEEGWE